MTPEELRRDETLRWLAAAAKDLRAASLLAAEEPTGSVFHSQQTAEKTAKARLAFHGPVPQNIQDLGKPCARSSALPHKNAGEKRILSTTKNRQVANLPI